MNSPNFTKILAAISQTEYCRDTLALAVALARKSGGELTILQAVELNIPGEERGINRGSLLRDLMSAAESRLAELGRALCGAVPFSVVVAEGPPSEVILRTAQSMAVAAIVMGPRRQAGFRWMRRDNVRDVVRQAACPVILVADAAPLDAAFQPGRLLGRRPQQSGSSSLSSNTASAVTCAAPEMVGMIRSPSRR